MTRRSRGFYNPGVSDERTLLTYRDYEELPADGRRYELHDGKLSVTPAPGTRHQRVIGAMHVLLRSHVDALRLGEVLLSPVDCILSDTTVVQPDLVYLDPTRAHLVSERGIEGPPTLVIEILSPPTTAIDRNMKRRLYAHYGIPYYWIVDPEAGTLEAYGLAEGPLRAQRARLRHQPRVAPALPRSRAGPCRALALTARFGPAIALVADVAARAARCRPPAGLRSSPGPGAAGAGGETRRSPGRTKARVEAGRRRARRADTGCPAGARA